MTKNSLLIPSLIGLGLISLALSLYVSSKTGSQKPGQAPLARIELSLGKVFILRKNMTHKEVLTKNSVLFPLDSVETGPDGDATMEFDSQYRIRIEENSLITLDLEHERPVLIIKRGELHVDNFGREESVFISRDGVRWNASDYERNYKKQSEPQALPEGTQNTVVTQTATAPSSTAAMDNSGLSSDAIQENLRQQRNAFFRCYTLLLQRTPGVVGTASISFTIEKTGKVFNAEVASSSINDITFKKCLIEAIRRVEFKPFNGNPISTIFPLKFE